MSPSDKRAPEEKEERQESNSGGASCEEIAVAHIKGEFAIGRNIYVAGQNAFGEGVASVVLQDLRNAPQFVNKACHAGVSRSNHRTAGFYTAEDGVGQMLT